MTCSLASLYVPALLTWGSVPLTSSPHGSSLVSPSGSTLTSTKSSTVSWIHPSFTSSTEPVSFTWLTSSFRPRECGGYPALSSVGLQPCLGRRRKDVGDLSPHTYCLPSHLPAYLVAAFAKRLARLALTAPPEALLMVLPLICNLLRRHPACRVMVHRPQGPGEHSSSWVWGTPWQESFLPPVAQMAGWRVEMAGASICF